ncbi:3-hydroxyacyl-ACP dehydratase FabZ family protein [Streptomyces sp. NPDC087440]|uniref:3-hydroxyacyl-ACP dehydratase FabZ family protein n=1 Tax=Streptomyces sp. NPDC087440 TaxID=3365790 RepID=UPI0037F9C3F3
MADTEPRQMGFTEIKEWVRHRYPVNYLDRITDWTPGESLTALFNVSGSLPCLVGHFPERAILPSSSTMMAFAQCGIVLYQLSTRKLRDDEITLMGNSTISSRRILVPGDQLTLHISCDRLRDNYLRFTGTAYVDGEVASRVRTSLIRKKVADLGPQLW